MGLDLHRDRLCVLQMSNGDGNAYLVQFDGKDYSAPNLKTLLLDANRSKIFHYARFDIAVIKKHLEINLTNLFCTKIASKLVRTYTDRHGLKDACRELLAVDLSKQQQSSDWAAHELSQAQLAYAASDVLHLHALREKMTENLEREGRTAYADECFKFLPTRAKLDLMGWENTDIFAHS